MRQTLNYNCKRFIQQVQFNLGREPINSDFPLLQDTDSKTFYFSTWLQNCTAVLYTLLNPICPDNVNNVKQSIGIHQRKHCAKHSFINDGKYREIRFRLCKFQQIFIKGSWSGRRRPSASLQNLWSCRIQPNTIRHICRKMVRLLCWCDLCPRSDFYHVSNKVQFLFYVLISGQINRFCV